MKNIMNKPRIISATEPAIEKADLTMKSLRLTRVSLKLSFRSAFGPRTLTI